MLIKQLLAAIARSNNEINPKFQSYEAKDCSNPLVHKKLTDRRLKNPTIIKPFTKRKIIFHFPQKEINHVQENNNKSSAYQQITNKNQPTINLYTKFSNKMQLSVFPD